MFKGKSIVANLVFHLARAWWTVETPVWLAASKRLPANGFYLLNIFWIWANIQTGNCWKALKHLPRRKNWWLHNIRNRHSTVILKWGQGVIILLPLQFLTRKSSFTSLFVIVYKRLLSCWNSGVHSIRPFNYQSVPCRNLPISPVKSCCVLTMIMTISRA